jgi:Type IV secretion system pilin
MSSNSHFKKQVKRIILWSVIIGGVIALFLPTTVQSSTTKLLTSSSIAVYAASPCQQFNTCPAGTPTTNAGTSENGEGIANFILTIALWLVYIAGALATLILVYGGIRYMTSNGDSNKTKTAVEIIKNAIIGLVLVIISFTIVGLIQAIVR